jgi:hypothetical protein
MGLLDGSSTEENESISEQVTEVSSLQYEQRAGVGPVEAKDFPASPPQVAPTDGCLEPCTAILRQYGVRVAYVIDVSKALPSVVEASYSVGTRENPRGFIWLSWKGTLVTLSVPCRLHFLHCPKKGLSAERKTMSPTWRLQDSACSKWVFHPQTDPFFSTYPHVASYSP